MVFQYQNIIIIPMQSILHTQFRCASAIGWSALRESRWRQRAARAQTRTPRRAAPPNPTDIFPHWADHFDCEKPPSTARTPRRRAAPPAFRRKGGAAKCAFRWAARQRVALRALRVRAAQLAALRCLTRSALSASSSTRTPACPVHSKTALPPEAN